MTANPIAVVGLACRLPDADEPAALLDAALTGRRAFRRLPPERLTLADYYQPDLTVLDSTYSTRAALIEGWRFDCAAFGIEPAAYAVTDPAHLLALETTARALADTGLPDGRGLDRDRTGVIFGNSLAGEVSRANALRLRWPYVRQVLTEALEAGEISPSQAETVLQGAESRFLAPFPVTSKDTLAGSVPGTISAGVCSYFGFRGGCHTIDSGSSSSLQAVASACTALASGHLDVAIAGGVDISLDPQELIGLAKAGLLATADVRVYDENPTGYLPGEGCGVLVLMRTADARRAALRVYAEIDGWGTSAGSKFGEARSLAGSHMLALRRAHERAGIDPASIQLIEGNGAGTPADDDAELTSLAALREGARRPAVLGSVKANIGHAKAAAGAAGLIKTVLAMSNGVLPPTTGAHTPHSLISSGDARLEMPRVARPWPDGPRLAAVSTLAAGGSSVHVVLRHEPEGSGRDGGRTGTGPRSVMNLAGPDPTAQSRPSEYRLSAVQQALPFLLHAHDRFALAAHLTRLADVARSLSDAQMQDLACTLARDPNQQGRTRVAIVAARQEQLAMLAREAVTVLPHLEKGRLTVRPGIFASDLADGKVTLLLSGDSPMAAAAAGPADRREPMTQAVKGCLDTLRWLESLDVKAASAVGDGTGALAGLAWAGVLSEAEVADIAALRSRFLLSSAGLIETTSASGKAASSAGRPGPAGKPGPAGRAGPADRNVDDTTESFHDAIAQRFRFGPPRRRLLSTTTGTELASVDDAIDLLCSGFGDSDELTSAISAGAADATLLLEAGPNKALITAAAAVTSVPAVSLSGAFGEPTSRARVACALFAAGALGLPGKLFDGVPARPIDIWRRQIFITNPCQVAVAAPRPVAQQPVPSGGLGGSSPRTGPSGGLGGSSPRAGTATSDRAISELRGEFEHHVPAPARAPAQDGSSQPDGTDHDGNGTAGGQSGPTQSATSIRVRQPAEPAADLGPWAQCFTEELRPSGVEPRRDAESGWRIHAAFRSPMLRHAGSVFKENPESGRTLAVLASPADADSRATAVRAARDAMATGQLVVLTTSAAFTGFFASLHAEHPAMGITVLRLPDGDAALRDAIRAANLFAWAEPGEFRELVVSPDGTASEPVLSAVPLTGGGLLPLDPDDVVLISRGARGAGLVLAQVMACCGNPVAVIGRAPGSDDSKLVSGLEELRSAGARVVYEVIDITDPASLAAALERIEDRLGPVCAIVHAATPGGRVPLHELSDVQVSDYLAGETAVLDQIIGSVKTGQLKLVVTVGSVACRYGLAGRTLYALGSGALASRAAVLARGDDAAKPPARLSSAAKGCRVLHLDMPPWSAQRLGDSQDLAADLVMAGTATVEIDAAARLLLKALATDGLPARLALHGAASGPALCTSRPLDAAELAAAGLSEGAAFLREVIDHYPGSEVVCEIALSVDSEPYLADYRIEGVHVLPEVIALEAVSQAASVLAGQPVRRADAVTMARPIVIPATGEARLRIYAQRADNVITTALRCSDSSFRVDHLRAQFGIESSVQNGTGANGTDENGTSEAGTDGTPAGQAGTDRTPAGQAAGSAPQLATRPAGLVDGAELYGPIWFQSGRFRRIALLPEVTAGSCRALARGADDRPWFASPRGPFLLGSPGLNDATLQAIQACVPHRLLRPAGCESVMFSGSAANGVVEIRARALTPVLTDMPAVVPAQAAPADEDQSGLAAGRKTAGDAETGSGRQGRKQRRAGRWTVGGRARASVETGPAASRPAGANAGALAAPSEQLWDVQAVDASGQLLVAWHKLRMSDVGPLPHNAAWPPQLLSVFLERTAAALGVADALEVSVTCGQPDGRQLPAIAVPRQDRTGPNSRAATAAGQGPLAGFSMTVTAALPVTCAWNTVESGRFAAQPVAGLASAYAQLRDELAEPSAVLAARLQAVGTCLARTGMGGENLALTRTTSDGWALLETPGAAIGSVVVGISGVPAPVAIALLAARPARSATRASSGMVNVRAGLTH